MTPEGDYVGHLLRKKPSRRLRVALERTATDRWVCTELQLVDTVQRAYRYGGWPAVEIVTGAPPSWRERADAGPWPVKCFTPALGQTMTAESARGFADALERLLADNRAPHFGEIPIPDYEPRYFDDDTLLAFVRFLRRGGFAIVAVDDPFTIEEPDGDRD